MTTLQERLHKALAASGKTKIELARFCSVSHPSVSNWFNGRTKELTSSNALKAAEFLGVIATWLTRGEGNPDDRPVTAARDGESVADGFICVPEYNVRCGAGCAGEPTYEEVTEARPAYYREEDLRAMGVSAKNLRRLIVHGDSMNPVLYDKDKILVDCKPQRVVPGKVYAFCFGEDVRVKRLFPLLSGGMKVHSDNPALDDEEIPPEEMSKFFLIGRVIERSGSAPLL